jgi:tetratricopeptide (TPR) repeat protein
MAKNLMRSLDTQLGELATQSAKLAELLDELVRLPQVRGTPIGKEMLQTAVDRYRELCVIRPEASVAVAGLLAWDRRHAEAMQFLRERQNQLPMSLLATAGLAVLRQPGAIEQDQQVIAQWIQAAKAADPVGLAPRLQEGELYLLQHNFAQAEAAYRAVLERDPKNLVALNNLAWILAPRAEMHQEAMDYLQRAAQQTGFTPELQDTRARIRLAAKQFELAEQDLREALRQQKSPLRMFHLALVREKQPKSQQPDSLQWFREAQSEGLHPAAVHPADLPEYRRLEGAVKQ